jgi:hypothetical protein
VTQATKFAPSPSPPAHFRNPARVRANTGIPMALCGFAPGQRASSIGGSCEFRSFSRTRVGGPGRGAARRSARRDPCRTWWGYPAAAGAAAASARSSPGAPGRCRAGVSVHPRVRGCNSSETVSSIMTLIRWPMSCSRYENSTHQFCTLRPAHKHKPLAEGFLISLPTRPAAGGRDEETWRQCDVVGWNTALEKTDVPMVRVLPVD